MPNEAGKVKMYTCGPTVYHFAHIGNLRTYIMEDVLEKTFRYLGYDVTRVMNVTDVGHLTSDGDTGEDKMLKGAKREKKTVLEIAEFYKNAFFADCAKLDIKTPDIVQPATGCIAEFIEMVQTLLDKDYAYFAEGNVYFDTSKAKDYYELSGHSTDELMVGVRDDVSEDTNKRNKSDFVLWFTKSKFDDQELKWESYINGHVTGSYVLVQQALPYLKQSKAPRIVFEVAPSGLDPVENVLPFSTAKGGVIALAKGCARQLAKYGITVNCVNVGKAITADTAPEEAEQQAKNIPLGRCCTGADYAFAVETLICEEASYVTGAVLNLTGGIYVDG